MGRLGIPVYGHEGAARPRARGRSVSPESVRRLLAHAVGCARAFVGDDDFVVHLGDNILNEEIGFGRRERVAVASVYELLYSRREDNRYLDVVRTAGRPVREERLPGPVTLTHANRFELGTASSERDGS